jgi:2-hydroxy-3-keto-5-methylthiopentenyl-1-phosphate phosphatase
MKGYRVIVTRHCQVRAKQRLRLFLRQHELENIERFIRQEFKDAYKCIQINNVPFYKANVGCEIFITKFVKFYCKVEGEVIIIKTIVKNRGEWRY